MSHAEFQAIATAAAQAGEVLPAFDFAVTTVSAVAKSGSVCTPAAFWLVG